MNVSRTLVVLCALLSLVAAMATVANGEGLIYGGESRRLNADEIFIRDLVLKHAWSWAYGCKSTFVDVIGRDIVFAYPTANLNYEQTLLDFDVFVETSTNTTITIPLDGIVSDWQLGIVYVTWKFETYSRSTGVRQVVNDICKGVIRDGQFVQWLEFLDGRVRFLQAAGILSYDDGPDGIIKPWPAFMPGKENCRGVVQPTCPSDFWTQEGL
ncbi:hypothetical protein [Mollivirus kamchatka]|nr:hypothetical protein [Mollivirus kamchatka]